MPSIRQYAGKWRVEVERHGTRASKLCDTKAEARDWGYAKEAELESLKLGKGSTFAAAVKHYLATVSIHKKEGAALWESRRFAAMLEFFGEKTPLAKIDSARIGAWRDSRLKSVKGSTVQRESNLLRNLFTKARREWKWIKESPFEGVSMPGDDDPREIVWRWQDIRRVLRHCQSSDGLKTRQVGMAFHISLRTALRLKEALSAELVGQVIILTDSKGTKKGKVVKVPTTFQGRRVMQKYKPPFDVDANMASTLFSEACKECGVRTANVDGPTFHDARATALTHMSKRMPVQRLQRISRHRDINILTRTYYRETAEQISADL